MSFEEILEACEKVESYGLNKIQFVLEKGKSSVIKGFGRGELACVATNGNKVFWYDVKKVKKTILGMMNENTKSKNQHNKTKPEKPANHQRRKV